MAQLLGDLTDAWSIHTYCARCRRYGDFPPAKLVELARKHGPDVTLEAVYRAMKCAQCGSRDVDPRLTPDGKPLEEQRKIRDLL